MKFNSTIDISIKLKIIDQLKNWEKSNLVIRILLILLCIFTAHSNNLYNYYTLTGFALYLCLILWLGVRISAKLNLTIQDVTIPTCIDIVFSSLLIMGSGTGDNPFISLPFVVILLTLIRPPIKQSTYLTLTYILFLTSYFGIYIGNNNYLFACLLMLLSFVVIQKLIKAKESLEVASYTDHLTRTFNRRYFHKYIPLLASSSNLVMLMVDINNLKQINDNYGHDCGDNVIKVVADTLKKYSKKNGLTIRWGGDEFLVLLFHVNEQEYANITEQIKTDISQNFVIANKTKISISASIGITQKLKNETFLDTINRVDKQMYKEKNKVHYENAI